MSAVIYIKKGADGRITALSHDPGPDGDPDWSALDSDAPEVRAFIAGLSGAEDALSNSDLPFVRVLEDVIDLLTDHAVIRFTDLPPSAQAKLLQRRSRRQQRQCLRLLGDEEPI